MKINGSKKCFFRISYDRISLVLTIITHEMSYYIPWEIMLKRKDIPMQLLLCKYNIDKDVVKKTKAETKVEGK